MEKRLSSSKLAKSVSDYYWSGWKLIFDPFKQVKDDMLTDQAVLIHWLTFIFNALWSGWTLNLDQTSTVEQFESGSKVLLSCFHEPLQEISVLIHLIWFADGSPFFRWKSQSRKSWGGKMNQKSLIVVQNFRQNFFDFIAKYARALFDPPWMCLCGGSNGSKRQL